MNPLPATDDADASGILLRLPRRLQTYRLLEILVFRALSDSYMGQPLPMTLPIFPFCPLQLIKANAKPQKKTCLRMTDQAIV